MKQFAQTTSANRYRLVSLLQFGSFIRRVSWVAALFLLLASDAAIYSQSTAAAPFSLRDGQRIVFLGDSITQGGTYIVYLETFLRTRFPAQRFEVINHGISSETISGTSETDHNPRRPWALNRLERDVIAWQPDVVVSCFGMNDGNYHPFEPTRFQAYQQGIQRLEEQVARQTKAQLVLMTPPPFDAYQRKASDPQAVEFGYKFPAIDYDQTLAEYSRWLVSRHSVDRPVVDLHSALNDHLALRRQTRVSFHLAPDAVHPNATGHWLMAQTLLLAWHAPAVAEEAEFDAFTAHVNSGQISELQAEKEGWRFAWTAPIPLPRDPQIDPESWNLAKSTEKLNRYRLAIKNLPPGNYQLAVEGRIVANANQQQWSAGLDLGDAPQMPPVETSQEVLRQVTARSKLLYAAWRKSIAPATAEQPPVEVQQAWETAVQQGAELDAKLRVLCQPQKLNCRLIAGKVE